MERIIGALPWLVALVAVWYLFRWVEKLKGGTTTSKIAGAVMLILFIVAMLLALGEAQKSGRQSDSPDPVLPGE